MRSNCSGEWREGTLCQKKKTCRALVILAHSQACRKLKESGMVKEHSILIEYFLKNV